MTIEELKQHCIKTIRTSEAIESIPNVKITDSRRLQEHKMVLKLIEAWEKMKEEIEELPYYDLIKSYPTNNIKFFKLLKEEDVLHIIDKHLKEVSE